MNICRTMTGTCVFTIFAGSCLVASAREPSQPPELTLFSSTAGGFTILLPSKPVYSSKEMPDEHDKETVTHHQYMVGEEAGVFMVTYESIAGTKVDTPERLEAAYLRAQGAMEKTFGGKVLEYKHSKLDKTRIGRFMRISIPARQGEYRARMFIVGKGMERNNLDV